MEKKIEKKSCSLSCGPSDWYKGGKCDINGCYHEGADQKINVEKTKNLASGGKFRLEQIPVRKFYDQAQYIEKSILPKVAETRGKDSADYQFFNDVYRSLLYAVMIVDRDRTLVLKMQQINQINQFLQERADLAERELLKYTTMEDLYATGAMDHIAAGVVQRVNDLLTNKG